MLDFAEFRVFVMYRVNYSEFRVFRDRSLEDLSGIRVSGLFCVF